MTTTLEVLNHVLNVVGETPVTDAESDYPSVISAMSQIERVNKEMQTRGWWFNTEYSLNLVPNELGQIIIPSNTISIDPVDAKSALVVRGNKLYDPVQHTFVLNYDVLVDAILLLEIEDLPENAASYLKHKAAYDFYVNDDGDETKSNRLSMQVERAWAYLQSEQLKNTDVNALHRPTVALIKSRTRQSGSSYNPTWPGGRG